MKTLPKIAEELGKVVELKRDAYGDSIASSTAMLAILFPAGIPPARYDQVLLIARVLDKLQRLATGADKDGECPWLDIAGYGICGLAQFEKAWETEERWQGSVSGPDATLSSKEQPASAEPRTNQPTTTSASEPDASAISPRQGSSSLQSMDVTALTAAESAVESVAGLLARVRSRNRQNQCGICTTRSALVDWMSFAAAGEQMYFCSRACRADYHRLLREYA